MSPSAPETPETREAARKAEAAAVLSRVARETETIGASSLASQPRAGDGDGDDLPIDIWGRRIGQGLGVLAALYMIWQLVNQFMT